MKMICPEVKCPRREVCASAKPHDERKDCSQGCQLHDELHQRKHCIKI